MTMLKCLFSRYSVYHVHHLSLLITFSLLRALNTTEANGNVIRFCRYLGVFEGHFNLLLSQEVKSRNHVNGIRRQHLGMMNVRTRFCASPSKRERFYLKSENFDQLVALHEEFWGYVSY